MTVEQFEKKQSEMADKELLEKTRQLLSKLCQTGGKSLSMSVPPNVNDFDMLICELMRRYNKSIWNNIEDKKPLTYKTGLFDGKKSDKVLVIDKSGKYHIAEMYEGFLDGSDFCDFYDDRDFEITNIIFWKELESSFYAFS